MSFPADADLVEFVYQEARLIDEKRLDEWYGLFAEDALYWMPLTRNQPDGELHTSLFYEDRFLLKLRIERLKRPASYSQNEPSYCQHVLQRPQIEARGAKDAPSVVRTPFVYIENQRDNQIVLGGVAWHHLVALDGALRIRLKKIELLNREAALPSIQLFP
ncbi:MAG: aromatic-ring-hydroxylating dioxygenase subunit beta [Steroidobacteraceae bacterium]